MTKRKIHNPPAVDGMIYTKYANEIDGLINQIYEILHMNARKYSPDNEQIEMTTYYWGINAVGAKFLMNAHEDGDTFHKCESDIHDDGKEDQEK